MTKWRQLVRVLTAYDGDGQLVAEADLLAYERAERQGVSPARLLSSAEEMATDFVEAERAVARRFQARSITLSPDDLRIDDVLVEVAGAPVKTVDEVKASVGRMPPGTWLPLKLRRQAEFIDLTAKVPPQQ